MVADVAAEARPHEALGDGHADRVADALAKWPRRHLDTVGVAALGMPRCPASPLAERLDVVQREVVAGQVQQRVEEDAGMAVRQDEAVTVRPVRRVRIVSHDPGPEHMGQRRQRHGGARVTRVGLLGGVHGQAADDVDTELHQRRILDDRGVLGHGPS
jgi:hypothetical protein